MSDAENAILLKDIWPIENVSDYKVHFGHWNGNEQPLDAWVRAPSNWVEWQEHRPGRNDFNRPYIFSLMEFYHEKDTWLFGGVFRVLSRYEDRYKVTLTELGKSFIGRLKLLSSYRERQRRVNFENHYDGKHTLQVLEILREPYSGQVFPGYEKIDLSFDGLEILVQNDRPDWKAALESVKGIYLITDTKTGKRYVGSAYGDQGIWSRWRSYIDSGHGGNIELQELVKAQKIDYCRANFRFALLEYRPAGTPDETIHVRESYWKDILLSRNKKFGLNKN